MPVTFQRIASPVALLLAAFAFTSMPRAGAQSATLPPANPDGVAQAVVRQAGLEGRVLWLDGTANLERLSTREGVALVMEHAARAHFNTVVVDVKPLSGHILYEGQAAPKLKEWRGFKYPAGYDLLRTALDEGHRRGLKVYAGINVFSDGHKLVKSGPVYDKPDEQSIIYDVERTLTTPRGDRKTLAVGVNEMPEGDDLTAWDPSYRMPRFIQPGEAFALVLSDQVANTGDASAAPKSGIRIPSDGYLLVGRGESARWMLGGGIRIGDVLTWTATDKLIPIVDAPSENVAAFMNPANPTSRMYELRVVQELVDNYDIDGIVYDRMRYASLRSDFSDLSRQKFEEYLGTRLNRFPGDIMSFDPTPGRPLVLGQYFKQWLEWRARNIRTWLEQANAVVKGKRPQARTAVYVGSWYPTYYSVGVNWGSEEFMPNYDWMSSTYNTTGYAALLDWATTGCYYPMASREQAKNAGLDDSYTVQAAAEMSTKAIGDQAFVYAGLLVSDYKGSPAAFREAIQAACDYSHGVMIFDLSYIEDYGWWNVLEEAFQQDRKAPHEVPELLPAIRSLRKALSAANRNSLP